MKIELSEYSTRWPEDFETEKRCLFSAIGKGHSIEHMGSTAIEGLVAKPVIDILIGINHFSKSEVLIAKIVSLGYDYIADYEQQLPERRYFQKIQDGRHLVHIHLVEKLSSFWNRHLFFRNRLRLSPLLREQYADLKKSLAQREWQDADDYAAAKTNFIQKIEAGQKTYQWHTGRLDIRLPDYHYLEPYYQLLIDPDVMKYIGDGTHKKVSKVGARNGIENLLVHFYQFGFTLGFVFLKNSDVLIGRAGLLQINGLAEAPIEVAYMLEKPYWNRGYGTELANYFIDWGFSHLKIDRLVGISHPEHATSQNILKKCGMSLVGDYVYGTVPCLMFEIRRSTQ